MECEIFVSGRELPARGGVGLAMNDVTLINQIRIASPCPARWDEMTGDERARFCSHCHKHVYNLSALTTSQAAALVREKEGNLCARFFQRSDGTMLTADCPVGIRRIREAIERRFTAVVATIALLLFGSGCSKRETRNPVAGGITFSPTQTNQTCSPLMGDVTTKLGQVQAPLMGRPSIQPVHDN